MKYLVKANHPILKRIDEFIDAKDLFEFVAELSDLGYENIFIDTLMPMAYKAYMVGER